MTYADDFDLRTDTPTMLDVADAVDGLITRVWGGTTSGSATAYTVTPSPAWSSYVTGSIIAVTPHTTGTGAATLNVSSLGTKAIRHKNRALVGGELIQDREALLVYDGTYFELVNHGGGWVAWTPTVTGEGSLAGSITSGYTNYQCHGSETLIDMAITLTTSGSDDDTLIFTCPTTVVTNSLGWAGCCVVSSSTLAPLLGNALSSDSKIRATVIGSTWGTGANRQVYLRMRYIG